MAPTNESTGSGLGRFGKQTKPRFKPVARRSHLSGVRKMKHSEGVCLKALEALTLIDVRTQSAPQRVTVDVDIAKETSPVPTILLKKPRAVELSLLSALPKAGLCFSEKNLKLQLFLGRRWKDIKVVHALCKDIPRGQKPNKGHLQSSIIAFFHTATWMLEEGNLGPVELVDAAETTQHMWLEFLKKLYLRLQLNWPTELSFGLFTCFFSALVDAREAAKASLFLEDPEIEVAREELAGLTIATSRSDTGIDFRETVKPLSARKPRREPGELVKAIDMFLDAVIGAGTIWSGVEEVEDLE
ncbi:hypothetical protein N0V93_001920 [Gnomoniopsis smithogilvyi]|uniref:Uncharacterized protein n=1 Tax=Gnomoniopsis smithogilvyi TaxID=1191159 RepID=A0A9W8Z2K5_9PEZI|nr:hypothetical protein N0V93_001920 [Gnomoniopsis smithogilvyi]